MRWFGRQPVSSTVDRLLDQLYDHYGILVGQRPWHFLVASLITTALLSTGLSCFRSYNDIRLLYTPLDSLSLSERKVDDQFWAWKAPDKDSTVVDDEEENPERTVALFILLRAEQRQTNIFNKNLCEAIERINENIQALNDSSFAQFRYNSDGNSAYNHAGRMLCKLYFNPTLRRSPNVRFRYPYLTAFGFQLYLGLTIAGIDEYDNGTLSGFESFSLGYSWLTKRGTFDEFSSLMRSVDFLIQPHAKQANLTHVIYSDELANQEVNKNAVYTFPYLAVSAIAVLIFCTLSNWGKSVEALLGCLSSLLAVLSSFGLLAYANVPFNSIVVVTPFLALAIGIDDTFIAINAWRRTDPKLSVEERFRLSIRESGCAITVTSLTDVALFCIGTLSNTPAIRVFSQYTATAMAFDFFYQLTFVAPAIVLGGRLEHQKRHNRNYPHPVQALPARLFKNYYAPLLNSRLIQAPAMLLYVLYILIAFWGCCHIRVNMSISMLLVDESPLRAFFDLKDEYLRSSVAVTVHVRRPPDLNDDRQLSEFWSMVSKMEQMPQSRGSMSSFLWLRDYMMYTQNDRNLSQPLDALDTFLNSYQYRAYANTVRWYKDVQTGATVLNRFLFQTYYATKGQWEEVTALVNSLRTLAQHYQQFNVTIFISESFVWDQFISIPDNTIQTVGVGVLCMLAMSALFIPHMHSVFWIGLTLLSMDLGVIGGLSLWGVTLDPVSMINIIMSLDFPVEYAAHVCHCFYRMPDHWSNEQKLVELLGNVAWPLLQGGTAALLATLPLGFVPSYVIRVFFRTVVLILSIGMLHALVWLPLFLVLLTPKSKVGQKSISCKRSIKQLNLS
ncbi:Patched domain-containing protein 3 [Trichinella pseudospiralis]|uniref:Patched domain-containing protein 3 n=2 Tax=Trichinella pseudospiralis TaxID=6337 RepID=A0A0V1JNA1_TRIPS|nr:Patched domain-containing protein 3 [Trichinella pseudospiralis]KRZ36069.1 Patched domain-containing protein 3 [Trichinella pseudospiralis]